MVRIIEENILASLTLRDILYDDKDSLRENIMKKIEKSHPYSITPPNKEGGRWQTSYRDKNGKRKNIKASSKEQLLLKLAELYNDTSHIDNLTFDSLFDEWIEYKRNTVSVNTIVRHKQRYKRYFAQSKLHDMKIKEIDDMTLENICNEIVKKYELTGKEWRNAKTIPLEMFEYAVRKKYISSNPVTNMKIQARFKQQAKKTGKTETFNTQELEELRAYLIPKYTDTHNVALLAIYLNFYLGLRIGELVALKWEEIKDSELHICREEILNRETREYEIVEHTKTCTDRYVFLTEKAQKILKMIPRDDNQYIFVREGKRLHTRQVEYVLEKYAKDNNLNIKSSHKIRKTYASLLNAAGIPLDAIRELLGHSRLSTTLSYLFNPLTDEETRKLIEKAFK